MLRTGLLFATAAAGFFVASIEPSGIEPTLPDRLCWLMGVISAGLSAVYIGPAIGAMLPGGIRRWHQ